MLSLELRRAAAVRGEQLGLRVRAPAVGRAGPRLGFKRHIPLTGSSPSQWTHALVNSVS